MIVFAPEYDSETIACASIAARVADSTGAIFLTGSRATRAEALRAMQSDSEPRALMCFGHGSVESIAGQRDESKISAADFMQVDATPVFAYCCFSAILGRDAHADKHVWWGYDVRIVPPPLAVLRKSDIENVFRYVAQRFPQCRSESDVRSLLDELHLQCENNVKRYRRDQRRSGMTSFVFFMQILTRLRVWTPWSSEPIAHSQAWRGQLDDCV